MAAFVQSKVIGCATVARLAGLRSVGAEGVGGGATPVELIKTKNAGNAPLRASARSGRLSPFRSAATLSQPPTLIGGGGRYWIGAWNVPSPFPFRIWRMPELPSPRLRARSWKPSPL